MYFEKEFKVIALLLWKSWKIRFHYKCCFATLFLLPLIFPALYVLVFKFTHLYVYDRAIGNGSIIPAILSQPFDVFKDSAEYFARYDKYDDSDCTLLYTPSTNYTDKVMQIVKSILETKANVSYRFILNTTENEKQMRIKFNWKNKYDHENKVHHCGGIVFRNIDIGNGKVPKSIHYDVVISDSFESRNLYRHLNYIFPNENGYQKRLFLAIQAAVDLAHIRLITNGNDNLNLFVQQFPLPAKDESFSSDSSQAIALSILFSFSLLFVFPVTVKRIVEEKSTRVKEYLCCCGVNQFVYWTTTNFDTFCLVSAQTLAMYCIFAIPQNFHVRITSDYYAETKYLDISIMESFNASNIFMFFVFFVYCWHTAVFASFLTIFFNSANVAAAVSIVIWILTTFYPIFLLRRSSELAHNAAIFPNCGLFLILYVFSGRHYLHQDYNGFHNMFESSRWNENLNTFQVLLMMIASIFVYSLLTWYCTEVWPWQKGIAKPFYFPFAKYYNKYVLKKDEVYESEYYLPPLNVNKISKTYSKKQVLNNVDFELEENSLTVLLGPNGSGKSTLINIICGLTSQTKGKVFVKGNDTEKLLEKAQSFLGFCPQHNPCFKYLTVREQIEMIYTLKCALRQRLDGFNVDDVIQMLNLNQFAHQIAVNLSGGILRRTTIAMAIVGPSDVLVIDEPTESLDPIAKRKVWDMLMEARKSRTILVCSHQLDEVNVIADKVAVIVSGELKCVKTTLELKKEHGMGYTIKITKNPEFVTNMEIRKLIELFSELSTCEAFNDESEELIFHVPFDDCSQMSSLIEQLERKQFSLGIESISLHVTTLEDIYSSLIEEKSNHNSVDDWNFESDHFEEEIREADDVNPFKLYILQFQSQFVKNFHYQIRNYNILIILILIPLTLNLIVMWLFNTSFKQTYMPRHRSPDFDRIIYGDDVHSFIDSSDPLFTDEYKSLAKNVYEYNQNDELQYWILERAELDIVNYFKTFLFGVSFTRTILGNSNITAWYNPAAVHAPPISLNMAMNAYLKMLTKDDSYSIKIANNWYAESIQIQEQEAFLPNAWNYDAALVPFLIIIYSLCYSAYILRPINERRIGFKHLQLMTGMQPFVYWLSHFIFDLLLNSFCSCFHIAFIYFVDTENIIAGSDHFFLSLFIVYFVAGFAYIPFVYCFSYMFKKPTTAYLFVSVFATVVGLPLYPFGIMTVASSVYDLSIMIFIFAPFVSIGFAMVALVKSFAYNTFCDRLNRVVDMQTECNIDNLEFSVTKICCPVACKDSPPTRSYWPYYRHNLQACHQKVNPFHNEINYFNASTMIAFMIIGGIIYISLANILQYYSLLDAFKRLWSFFKRKLCNETQEAQLFEESSEVTEERRYVNEVVMNNRISQESLVMQNLTKQFQSLRIPNNLSLTVRKGECLGLLGGNACGKTTTFRLLTSQMVASSGNAFIDDLQTNLKSNTRKYLSLIGYCPQNDALLDCLTGNETIDLFMKLRGMQNIHHMQRIINKFHLQPIINQRVSTYSGGNRRKLSLALALIGNQKLLLLDEPTNGIDPCSRSKVWQLLKNISESFQVSILLTSHNMQEVEVLCTRVAVMSVGKVQCIGTVNELSEKYGKGFILVIKVERGVCENEEDIEVIKSKVKQTFEGETVTLKYENFGVLHYNVTSSSISLSGVFEKLEEIRRSCKIEDYFVSNASLEQSLMLLMKNN